MMIRYSYEIAGTAANNQTWTVTGHVMTIGRPMFPDVPHLAMRDAFNKLTDGRAEFGKPGVGCKGPYLVKKMVLQEDTPDEEPRQNTAA